MTASVSDFKELLKRAGQGDSAALDQLARTYESDLRIAARVHLGPALRPYLDSIDLVQSVHRSIFRGLRSENFNLNDPNSLVALAMVMVRRKVARQWRRHRRQLRLDGLDATNENSVDVLTTLTSRAANPHDAAEVRDGIDRLYRELDDADRKLLELRLQGWTTVEAAEKLETTPESLRVRLFRLRKRLTQEGVFADWLDR